METIYHVLFTNGTKVQKTTFEDADKVPYSNYIIREGNTNKGNPNLVEYSILDKDGSPYNLKIGNFELIDISPELTYHGARYHDLTFFEILNNKPFSIESRGYFINNFYEAIVNFMNRLNELGSYEAFQNLEKIQNQEKDIASLYDRLSKKDERIKELEEEIRKLKEG